MYPLVTITFLAANILFSPIIHAHQDYKTCETRLAKIPGEAKQFMSHQVINAMCTPSELKKWNQNHPFNQY